MADLEGEDLAALAGFKKKAANKAVNSAAARHAADKKSNMKPTDGRRLRATGVTRDAQINFKISSETKRSIVDTAKELGVPMVYILERGLELIRAEAEKAAQETKAKNGGGR